MPALKAKRRGRRAKPVEFRCTWAYLYTGKDRRRYINMLDLYGPDERPAAYEAFKRYRLLGLGEDYVFVNLNNCSFPPDENGC